MSFAKSLASAFLPLLLAGPVSAQTVPPAPTEPTLEFAFEELVTLAPQITPGPTAHGDRNIVPITGGTFAGPHIRGSIVPGGWDWQLRRADGCVDIQADYMLKTDDGVVINILNKGIACPPSAGEIPKPVRTSPVFEAPIGKYDWLSKGAFIGTLDAAGAPDGTPAVRIRIYRAR